VLNDAGRIYCNEEPMCDDPIMRPTVHPDRSGQEGPANQEGSAGRAARAKGSPILLILAPERRPKIKSTSVSELPRLEKR
jgi:hypothetical protein